MVGGERTPVVGVPDCWIEAKLVAVAVAPSQPLFPIHVAVGDHR